MNICDDDDDVFFIDDDDDDDCILDFLVGTGSGDVDGRLIEDESDNDERINGPLRLGIFVLLLS